MRILAVDDDDIALDLLSAAVTAADYRDLTLASSGEDALQKIADATVPFDCFLLDIEMPGIDGIDLCRAIRRMGAYRETSIVMITALTDRAHMNDAFAAGAIDYVTKPFDPLEISVRLGMSEKLLAARRASQASRSTAETATAALDGAVAFELADAVTISDVPGVVSELAMENFMLRLSRWQLSQSVAVAFSIAEIADIFARTSHSERMYLLSDAADAITSAVKGAQFLMSYCGHGTFVCIADKPILAMMDYLESAARVQMDQIGPVYDNGARCDMTVVMGEAATVPIWAARDPQQLIDRAVQSAEARRIEWLQSAAARPDRSRAGTGAAR